MYFPSNIMPEGIISKDKIVKDKTDKKLIFSPGIKDEEYDEVVEYIKQQNIMSSRNITLLLKEDLERFNRLSYFSILMRNEINNKLVGTILSIPFSIRCSYLAGETENAEYTKEMTILHGCTSFLNIHKAIRGFKIASLIIQELIKVGNEKNIFCSYQLTSFKLTENAIPINSWYRPINLMRSLLLGFGFPPSSNISDLMKIKDKYRIKTVKGLKVKQITDNNAASCLEFYRSINEQKRFLFYPGSRIF